MGRSVHAARTGRGLRRSMGLKGWAVVAGVLALLLGLGVWHHFSAGTGPGGHSLFTTSPRPETAPVTPPVSPEAAYPGSVVGRDGATLRLVPAGEARVDDRSAPGGSRLEDLPAFYLDETPVTNHQYVEFLNLNLGGLRVEENAVWKDDAIWLLLGEVAEHYEPVVYRDGRFRILDPAAAAKPVVRVTALGATAYSGFYDRALPTMSQWRRAEQAGGLAGEPGGENVNDMMHAMTEPSTEPAGGLAPVGDVPQDALGLRGMGVDVNEWTQVPRPDGSTEFHLLGGVDDPATAEAHVERQPWEAFPKAGFRTVYVPAPEER